MKNRTLVLMMKDQSIPKQLIIRTMRSEAEKIVQRLTNPSSETLMRIMYKELIDRVIQQIEANQQEGK